MSGAASRLRAAMARRLRRGPLPADLAGDGHPAPPDPDFPALRSEHVTGARLFADRGDLVTALVSSPDTTIAEVGVALGEFSEFLLNELRPSTFVAIDLFELHANPDAVFRGRTMRSVFGSLSHAEYYKDRFGAAASRVDVEQGLSWDVLARYPNEFFDLIYIDAAHDYDSVKRDAAVAVEKVKRDGVLVFNDYIMRDHLHNAVYGIVQNVNDLVVNRGWHVVGFALQRNLYCDIALMRAAAVGDWGRLSASAHA